MFDVENKLDSLVYTQFKYLDLNIFLKLSAMLCAVFPYCPLQFAMFQMNYIMAIKFIRRMVRGPEGRKRRERKE